MNTLYWHDYETTGTDPARDRPLQFAGVRTDEALNVLGEPLALYCRLSTDILPHPMACLITGITPQLANERGLPEPEFIARVHAELARPGTCGVGYNSLRFDDEVTRHTLYRNFYDPYEREWRHGNSRWDIIDMLRLARALRPDGVNWPHHDDGSPSFRLEDLATANGLDHESAHDALSDVFAAIALARLLLDKQPNLYRHVYDHRGKQSVAAQIDLVTQKPVLHVSGRLPRENGYLGLMMPLARHPMNKNAVIMVNLMADPRSLIELDAGAIRERLFTPAALLGEGIERIALKAIHLNRCPVVVTPQLLDPDAAARLGIDRAVCEKHWRLLRGVDLRAKLTAVFAAPETAEERDAELALYRGFLPDTDRPLLARVRAARAADLTVVNFPFRDPRYRELLFRYRARHYPDTLSPAERERWRSQNRQRLTDPGLGFMTLEGFEQELHQLTEGASLSSRHGDVLHALRQWGAQVAMASTAT